MNERFKPAVYLGIILLILGSIFAVPAFLKVEDVSCLSQYGPCNEVLSEKTSQVEGTPLAKAKARLKEILSKEVLVKNFSVHFSIPNKLEVNVIERKPKHAIRDIGKGKFALVDEEGYIVAIEDQSNLPFVEAGSSGNVGEKVGKENLFALNLVSRLFSSYLVKSGKVEEDRFLVEFKEGVTLIFPLEGDSDALISSLGLILKKVEGDKIKVKTIDFRFKNPVITE